MAKPTIQYFNIRGRAEVMRIALAYKNVDYDVVPVDYPAMKADTITYPFGQVPRYYDDQVDLVQSNVIHRYIGRKYGLLGSNEKQQCAADMVMEGVEALRSKYVALIYQDQLSDTAKEAFWKAHIDKASAQGRNGGTHLALLAGILERAGTGYVAGTSTPTMGDLCLWEMFDLLARVFPNIKEEYPSLAELHTRVAGLPGIKEYLTSPRRPEQPNANNLG